MKTEEQRLLDELYDRDDRIIHSTDEITTNKNTDQISFKIQDYPNAKLHQTISFIKSGVRILGYVWLFFDIIFAALILILSEVIGIIEEKV